MISTLFFLKASLVVLGVAIILWIAPQVTNIESAKTILPIVALILAFDSLREFGFSIARAKEKMEWEAALFLSTNLAIVVLGFAFLSISPTVSSFAYAYAAGTGLGALGTFVLLRKHLRGILSNFSLPLIRPILASAWRWAIASVGGRRRITGAAPPSRARA